MPSPSSFLAFTVINFIVWPGFALAYYYLFQRADEDRIEAMSGSGAGAEG